MPGCQLHRTRLHSTAQCQIWTSSLWDPQQSQSRNCHAPQRTHPENPPAPNLALALAPVAKMGPINDTTSPTIPRVQPSYESNHPTSPFSNSVPLPLPRLRRLSYTILPFLSSSE